MKRIFSVLLSCFLLTSIPAWQAAAETTSNTERSINTEAALPLLVKQLPKTKLNKMPVLVDKIARNKTC